MLKAEHYFDLSFTAEVMDRVQVFGGINNLFSNEPPVVGSAQVRANTYPATYNSLGGEFFIGAQVRF